MTEGRLQFAVLTPSGRGAVAVTALRGDLNRLATNLTLVAGLAPGDAEVDRIYYGHWRAGGVLEDVVWVRTAPAEAELHGHGGAAAVARIRADLREHFKAEELPAYSWSPQRDAWQLRECETTLLAATTQRAAAELLRQIEVWREALRTWPTMPVEERRRRMEESLCWATFGRRLTEPATIVIAGRPNVGKSSLMNRLAGFERSIVMDAPGTTRDLLALETAWEGWPLRFIDSAGIRATADTVERAGVRRACDAADQADLVLLLLDANLGVTDEDLALQQQWPDAIFVWNKIDLVSPSRVAEITAAGIAISAVTGEGLSRLWQAVTKALFPALPSAATPLPLNARLLEWLRQEVESLT